MLPIVYLLVREVKVMSLLIVAESTLKFSFGVKAPTEMKLWWVHERHVYAKSSVKGKKFRC